MINFNILYWDMGCEIRKQNAIISWKELKRMVNEFKSKGIQINCNLFEFGNEFIFEDSVKIDMNIDYYERSKKINMVINHVLNKDCDFISIMDSDLFFTENQYDKLLEDIKRIESKKEKIFFTYNLLDINEKDREKIINLEDISLKHELIEQINQNCSWRHSYGAGVLGGIFICYLEDLIKMGGFDERFLTWGGEDDEAQQRIKNFSSWVPKMFEGPYHLYHPKNENNEKYYIPVYSDEYFKINKIEKPI